jgi:hypothetical protein
MLHGRETSFEVSSALNAEEDLPEQVFAIACDLSDVRACLDDKLAAIESGLRNGQGLLSGAEKQAQAAAQDRLSRIYTAIVDLRIIEDHLLEVTQTLQDGTITEQEVFNTLPVTFTETPQQVTVSKRRRAIAEQQARESRVRARDREQNKFIDPIFTKNDWALFGDLSPVQPLTPTGTDPRRIASGRHQTRLNAGPGLSSVEAESAFMQVTADTHGGKTRNYGKNGTKYVGKSGRTIRKK